MNFLCQLDRSDTNLDVRLFTLVSTPLNHVIEANRIPILLYLEQVFLKFLPKILFRNQVFYMEFIVKDKSDQLSFKFVDVVNHD